MSVVNGENPRNIFPYFVPKYEIPSRRTFGREEEVMFEQSKTSLRSISSNISSLSLTYDTWTSVNMEAFFGVTAHFIDESFKLHSGILESKLLDERHEWQYIASQMEEILQEFGNDPSIVTAAVSDNGANMKSAKQLLKVRLAQHCLH